MKNGNSKKINPPSPSDVTCRVIRYEKCEHEKMGKRVEGLTELGLEVNAYSEDLNTGQVHFWILNRQLVFKWSKIQVMILKPVKMPGFQIHWIKFSDYDRKLNISYGFWTEFSSDFSSWSKSQIFWHQNSRYQKVWSWLIIVSNTLNKICWTDTIYILSSISMNN